MPNKQDVYREIEDTLGVVPNFFKVIPEQTLEPEWNSFRQMMVDNGPIPAKYFDLIGLAIAATTNCRVTTYFHTEVAKIHGATEEEINSALLCAKHVTGWSTFVNGTPTDFEESKYEVDRIVKHLRDTGGVKSGEKIGVRPGSKPGFKP